MQGTHLDSVLLRCFPARADREAQDLGDHLSFLAEEPSGSSLPRRQWAGIGQQHWAVLTSPLGGNTADCSRLGAITLLVPFHFLNMCPGLYTPT